MISHEIPRNYSQKKYRFTNLITRAIGIRTKLDRMNSSSRISYVLKSGWKFQNMKYLFKMWKYEMVGGKGRQMA